MQLITKMAVFASLALASSAGCAASHDETTDTVGETGTLAIPLIQTGNDGALYRLSAAFTITGPSGTQFVDGSTNATSISLDVPPGLTTVELLDGWQLVRSTDGGTTFAPVSALLGSLNQQAVRILANHTAPLVFQFLVRNPDGELSIRFGVSDQPRELAGGWVVTSATDSLTAYAPNTRGDFAVYYGTAGTEKRVLPDGSKDFIINSDATATEFFNDAPGILTSTVAPALAGGYLEWHLIARPDGSQELSGTLYGQRDPYAELSFGPHPFDFPLPLTPDGYVSDAYFAESVPFSLLIDGAAPGTLAGTLRFRSIPN